MDTHQPNLNEAIDGCRPGGKDLLLPEMAELSKRIENDSALRRVFDRCQQLDAAIAQASHEVGVPDGFCAKLLANVGEANAASAGVADDAPANSKSDIARANDYASTISPPLVSRWLAIGGAVAACLFVAVVAARFIPNPPVPLGELKSEALGWVDQVQQQPWNSDINSAPDFGYPVDRMVLAGAKSWQSIDTAYSPNAVAFDLRANDGSRFACLMIVKSTRAFDVGQTMPSEPFSTTGRYAIGACKKGNLLFVLIVEGSKRRYQQFVRPIPPVM